MLKGKKRREVDERNTTNRELKRERGLDSREIFHNLALSAAKKRIRPVASDVEKGKGCNPAERCPDAILAFFGAQWKNGENENGDEGWEYKK